MLRRGFLGFLGASIAGATIDPDKLLWEPGRKLISIPNVVPIRMKLVRIPLQLTRGGMFRVIDFADGGDLGRGSYDIQTYDIIAVPETDPREGIILGKRNEHS